MDGIHDMGGMAGFGEVERDEAAFHEPWEARVFAIAELCAAEGLIPNTDAFRHAIERMHPEGYLTAGYFGRWLNMTETLLHEMGHLSHAEMEARMRALGLEGERVPAIPATPPFARPAGPTGGDGARRAIEAPPRYRVGERVVASSVPSTGHTRLPRYARGRTGAIRKQHGGWVFPDTNAHGLGEKPQHLYTVMFEGIELWGPGSDPSTRVYLDLFEDYLEPVTP